MKLKLNVYPAIKNLEEKIAEIIKAAKKNRAKSVEIAYGRASVATKKRILKALEKKEYRKLYSRLQKAKGSWGRIFIYFRWK